MTTAVDERRDVVEQMTLAGMSAWKIAEQLGVSDRTVVRDRIARGVTVPTEPHQHGRYRYSIGCRCDTCREWNRERVKAAKARRIARGTGPRVHGVSGYRNYNCRCEVCTAEHSAKCRSWYRQARGIKARGVNA